MSRPKPDPKKTADDKKHPHDGGWRETVESIAMAVILALLFRGFVAEAFVIPTGSMAPTLLGRHKDVQCPKCRFWYQTGASTERDEDRLTGRHVTTTTCPMCRYTQNLDLFGQPNDHSFSGDRIIVGKFAYDLAEPKRWDVIVFKYPDNAVQNYIKRLTGLPGEKVRVVGGNIHTCKLAEPDDALRIARKPPHKLDALLQLVDDTNYIPPDLTALGWPPRWKESGVGGQESESGKSAWKAEEGGKSFVTQGDHAHDAWLRYRHLFPSHEDWLLIDVSKQLPSGVSERKGRLITDFYAYDAEHFVLDALNPQLTIAKLDTDKDGRISKKEAKEPIRLDKEFRFIDADDDGYITENELTEAVPRLAENDEPAKYLTPERNYPGFYDPNRPGPGEAPSIDKMGQHWVDDLAVECVAEVTGSQGQLLLELVRGGIHHQCRINLQNGQATLNMLDEEGKPIKFLGDDDKEVEAPVAQTRVKGPGSYRLRLSNCDHEMLLWVNGSVVQFDGPTTYFSPEVVVPFWSEADPGDLAPAGVGSQGAAVRFSGLRIYRDKYYIAADRQGQTNDYEDFDGWQAAESIQAIFADPALWESSKLFADGSRRWVQFPLEQDQFLPMGDNSPQSFDGRFWHDRWTGEPHQYVERDLLIGKALLIYWPHTWNRPIPFTPNFSRMGRIR